MDILRTIEGDHNARTESWLTGYSHSLRQKLDRETYVTG